MTRAAPRPSPSPRPSPPARAGGEGAIATATALAVAAAVLLACGGKNEEEKLVDEQRAACDALGTSAKPLNQAVKELAATGGFLLSVISGAGTCRGNGGGGYLPLPGGDRCDYTSPAAGVCATAVEWVARSSSLCDAARTGGAPCAYVCELRTAQGAGAVDPTSGLTDAAVCAAQFTTSQPIQ